MHIVAKHKDRPAYPGPADLEKYRQIRSDELKSKVGDMAETNLAGNGLLDNDIKT